MRLKNVTLNNFRCFEHLELTLHPRLTVIVGENGSGKTAVLDGIALALAPVLTYLSSANQRLASRSFKDTDARVQVWGVDAQGKTRSRKAGHAQVIAEADVTDLQGSLNRQPIKWDYWKAFQADGQPREKIGAKQLKDYLVNIQHTYTGLNPKNPPVVAYYGVNRGSIQSLSAKRLTKVNYTDPNSALYRALDSTSRLEEALEWFYGEESAELRANKELGNVQKTASPTLRLVREAVGNLLGDSYSNPHFDKDRRFLLRRKVDGVLLQVEQLSQGYQSMLALAIDFARRLGLANNYQYDLYWQVNAEYANKLNHQEDGAQWLSKLASVTPSIMLVDEIDLHLHPTWQQRVLSDLMQTFPLTQFIVTTHSPQVLSTVRRENIRILRETEAGGHEAVMPDFSPLAHEAGDALARVMGTHPHPPMPLQDTIHAFEQYVRAGKEDSPEAQQLKSALDQAGYQIHDSDLVTWRFLASRKLGQRG